MDKTTVTTERCDPWTFDGLRRPDETAEGQCFTITCLSSV